MLINNERPSVSNVQIKYDDKDYRALVFTDILSKAPKYTTEEIEKLNYEYIGVSINDSQHKSYTYRNCRYNILLEVTEWYNTKLVISLQWYSAAMRNVIPYLRSCNQ